MLSSDIIKTPPPIQPVGLEEMRQQLGITQQDDVARDRIIENHIKAATLNSEHFIRRALITQTRVYYADSFANVFDLTANLQSVASVNFIDDDGIEQIVDTHNYYVDTVNSKLYPAYGNPWPPARHCANSIAIQYTCGYGLPDSVPEDIKQAIKFIVGYWENHQTNIEEAGALRTIPYAAQQLLRPYVDMRNYF